MTFHCQLHASFRTSGTVTMTKLPSQLLRALLKQESVRSQVSSGRLCTLLPSIYTVYLVGSADRTKMCLSFPPYLLSYTHPRMESCHELGFPTGITEHTARACLCPSPLLDPTPWPQLAECSSARFPASCPLFIDIK